MTAQPVSSLPAAAPVSVPVAAPGSPRRVRAILALILLAALATGGRMWWRGHYFEETDNAYVEGHVSVVSPRIAGVVTRVLVADNQPVQAGDVLVELDPADTSVRVDQIKAQFGELDAEIRRIDAQVEQGRAELQSMNALVNRALVQATRTRQEAGRQIALYGEELKAVSRTELDAAVAARDSADADLSSQQAQLKAAEARILASRSARAAVMARKEVLAAQLKDAGLQLGYTTIRAPVSGRIGRKGVEVGAHVQAGQQLLAIVLDGVWVVANFKEVQLQDLYAGQKATIRIDAFPGRDLPGRIDSFSPASGAQFSLLPPDNATGNFTKIVQRVPVKITFDPDALGSLAGRIAPGLSALVEIDLRQGRPAASAP
jgi:membrane fusion protein (multidrug efflux system)